MTEIPPIYARRRLIPSSIFSVNVIKGLSLHHPQSSLLLTSDFYTKHAAFTFGEITTEQRGQVPSSDTTLKRNTFDMKRAFIITEFNGKSLIAGDGAYAVPLPIVTFKGSGESPTNVIARIKQLGSQFNNVSQEELQARLSAQEAKETLTNISDGTEGYIAASSIQNELAFEQKLSKYGVRTSKILATVNPKPDEFAAWVKTTESTIPTSYYPASDMLARLTKNNDQPVLLARAGSFRYSIGLRPNQEGRYSHKEILRSTARSYATEIAFKNYDLFAKTYGITIPESTLIPSLTRIMQGKETNDDLTTFLALETHMQAFNFGRTIAVSRKEYQGRLLLDPMEVQNIGFGAIMHDFESMEIPQEFFEPNAPYEQKTIEWAKKLVDRNMSNQITDDYIRAWQQTILPLILVKMAYPNLTAEREKIAANLMTFVQQGLEKGLTIPQ